jgi:uroporphyrinogen decarboxylase
LTTTMLHGTQQDNIQSVINLIDSVENKDNFIVSPGCDMPYATPIENTIACAQAAKFPESSRELIKNYEGGAFDDIEVEIPDYANSDKVIIELFLLDPKQCAACTYMLAAVEDAFDEMKDIAEYRVYQYFIKEDIARTQKMGVAQLPSLYINGEVAWSSIIPSKEELLEAVKAAAK